ncbi:formimidoylglutamate deiminase [Pseudonocardia spinosispora]|uniref:formimidoylglutamate deiminase n=1 Tax=Pseudonocardia spinosispora TaxID=103441 RepID=UPI0006868F07|nr:formimidoylglutamate deiminase [Pseudonocardia spinosispora]
MSGEWSQGTTRHSRAHVGYWCERAWVGDGVADRVLVEVDDAGVISAVATGQEPPEGAHRLGGVVFPGFANGHSHAFHRALRGRTHGDGGTFWTWREAMYRLAQRLDPDSYHQLARLVFAEMALAGYTAVGEFHYLHHAPGGRRYADPNAMGTALVEAAREAGVRLTLLDTCYLSGGLDDTGYLPLSPEQTRFSDGDVDGWLARVGELTGDDTVRIGAAVHSVRAVPATAFGRVAEGCAGRPLHVHLSEQPAENEACQAVHGCSPTRLLADSGLLGPDTTAVHATHLSGDDISLLGGSRTTACFCPSTEGDLADGIGPARELADAGSPISLGSDQHAVVDPLLEARALEHGERLRTGRRGRFDPAQLVRSATEHGHRSLGWDSGRIAPGALCDLVSLRPDTPRTGGALPGQLVLAATSADVHSVVVGGRVIVQDGVHRAFGELGRDLARTIGGLWGP